ncbi:MAG TPA: DVUA0089 family protein [Bryobacteraceae bacterium]|jgi:hypothetical protein|nr:DVUA0089 family protein [Bryobacteraceae bacterium]
MPHQSSLLLFTAFASALALIPEAAQASSFTLQGSFTHDDDVQLFDLTVAAAATVDIRSYGYSGGTTSTGTVVPSGGFDSILTLFDGTGTFIADNDEGAGVATDPSTGLAADARITTSLTPGSYIVALTEFDNFSLGNLSDGFAEAGNPNFTAASNFTTGGPCPAGMFRDISGTAGRCRDGNWSVDFVNVASVAPVTATPEPGTVALLGAGLLGLALFRKKRVRIAFAALRKPRKDMLLIALAVLLVPASKAQTITSDPDYSNVNDILDGQRTLLRDDDLIVTAFTSKGTTPSSGALTATVMTTANGQVSTVHPISNPLNIGDDRINKLFAGRFYESDHDLSMRAVPVAGGTPFLLLTDGPNPVAQLNLPGGQNGDVTFSAAAGDFTGNGYTDFAVNYGPGDETGKMAIFSGTNPDGSKNLRFGPVNTQETLVAMTAGDFNGDGRMEIAGLAYKRSGKYTVVIYTVDPNTLAITKAAELVPSYTGEDTSQAIPYLSMASGHFTTTAHAQVVLAYARTNTLVKIEVLDFAPGSLQPVEKSIYQTASGFLAQGGFIQVEAGRFSLTSPYDQVFFGFAWGGPPGRIGEGLRYFQVFQADTTNATLNLKSFADLSDLGCPSTFSVGNYDKKTTDSSGKTQPAFGLQVAYAGGTCNANSPGNTLRIYGVSPTDYSTKLDYTAALPSNLNTATEFYIDPADLQGRSYVLGEPSRIAISDAAQPSVIQSMPPMHVDFIPLAGSSQPEVLNVSGIPHGFYTKYTKTSSQENESSTTNTTSWGFGAMQKVEASVEIGSVEDGFGAKAGAAYTAAQNVNQTVESEHGSYQAKNFTAAVQTTNSDHIWYSANRFNIYIYPVIGKTVCPKDKQPCGAGDMQPLTLQFSAPDNTVYYDQDAAIVPWYQPPWEPFNVFSYPATYAQLLQEFPVTLQKLSDDSTWSTDSSVRTQETTWTQQSTNGSSVSSDQNYSTETEVSVAGACCGGIVKGSISAQLNLSASTGFSDLNKALATVGSSTGIGINKPGTFLSPLVYNYAVTPYIFGEVPPPSKGDNPPSEGDIQTTGMLRTAFVADPLAGTSGAWWRQAYSSAPDVALNHPARWHFPDELAENAVATPNCRPASESSSGMDCAVFEPPVPNNPFISLFHIMRGFFITSALNPGGGPQLQQAVAGDQLSLQTRVYNYSLARMPVGSRVHVRFYAQRFNKDTKALIGPSVLINNSDVVIDPIPPFSDAPGAPLNWVFARTNFDTTPYSGQNLVFWVVVWIEDSSGNLVPEIGGHGLTSIPGTLQSLADVPTETYSNNVGFYNGGFYVLPPQSDLNASSAGSEPAAIDIGKVQLSTSRTLAGQTIAVSALLSASGNSASGVTAVFYDGDPHNGGRAFGLERSPYIAQDDTYEVLAPYIADRCGVHELFVAVDLNTTHEVLRRAHPVKIDCSGFGSPQQ